MTVANPFDQFTRNAITAPTNTPAQEDSLTTLPSEISNLGSTELAEVKSKIPPTPSEKRLAANRANAQKSTGPKSLQGKIASAQNALKHGLRSKIYFENQPKKLHLCPEQSNHPMECGATYAIFEQEFKEELQPRTILQKSLFPQIVTLAWRLRRLPHTEQEIFARLASQSEISNPEPQIPASPISSMDPPTPPELPAPQSEISNPKSQITSPQSQIANHNSQILSTHSSFSIHNSEFSIPSLPPPCQTLADIFCTAAPSNPFTLFNRYERSLQNAYLRLLRQYHYLKKHHPTPPADHSIPLRPEPAWNPNQKLPTFNDDHFEGEFYEDDSFQDTDTNEPNQTPVSDPKTATTTTVLPNEANSPSAATPLTPSPGTPEDYASTGLSAVDSNAAGVDQQLAHDPVADTPDTSHPARQRPKSGTEAGQL